MYRRKVMMTAAAVFAFGVAFAAQPTSLRAIGAREYCGRDQLVGPRHEYIDVGLRTESFGADTAALKGRVGASGEAP
jgi:hypothetical protein